MQRATWTRLAVSRNRSRANKQTNKRPNDQEGRNGKEQCPAAALAECLNAAPWPGMTMRTGGAGPTRESVTSKCTACECPAAPAISTLLVSVSDSCRAAERLRSIASIHRSAAMPAP
jgi:hypothetical protein